MAQLAYTHDHGRDEEHHGQVEREVEELPCKCSLAVDPILSVEVGEQEAQRLMMTMMTGVSLALGPHIPRKTWR
jgi:hypothetical protein